MFHLLQRPLASAVDHNVLQVPSSTALTFHLRATHQGLPASLFRRLVVGHEPQVGFRVPKDEALEIGGDVPSPDRVGSGLGYISKTNLKVKAITYVQGTIKTLRSDHHTTGIERPRCVDRLPSHFSKMVESTVSGGGPKWTEVSTLYEIGQADRWPKFPFAVRSGSPTPATSIRAMRNPRDRNAP